MNSNSTSSKKIKQLKAVINTENNCCLYFWEEIFSLFHTLFGLVSSSLHFS